MPPLVGAIIGYITNWLAIKMLFRPLEPVYLGRFRLPFTPGILPKEKLKLAESVGDVVSKELLTPEVFTERLRDEDLRKKIESAIASAIRDLLSKEVPSLPAPADAQEGSAPRLRGILEATARRLVSSPEFAGSFSAAVGKALETAGSMPLRSLLPPERLRGNAQEFAAGCAGEDAALRADRFVDWMAENIRRKAEPILPEEAAEPLVDLGARALYESLLPAAEAFLRDPANRALLGNEAMSIVRRAISRLGPIQRIIVNLANYEQSLEEMMPRTIEDLSSAIMEMLRKPGMPDMIAATFLKGGKDARSGMILGFLPEEGLKEALRKSLGALGVDSEGFADRLAGRYGEIADKTLAEVFPGFADAARKALFPSSAPSAVGEGGSPILAGALGEFVAEFGRATRGKSLGSLLGWTEEDILGVAASLSEGIAQALEANVEGLLGAIDFRSIVVEKINSLDMLAAERIILRVVNTELQWITILGGILGALIGIVQSVLSIL